MSHLQQLCIPNIMSYFERIDYSVNSLTTPVESVVLLEWHLSFVVLCRGSEALDDEEDFYYTEVEQSSSSSSSSSPSPSGVDVCVFTAKPTDVTCFPPPNVIDHDYQRKVCSTLICFNSFIHLLFKHQLGLTYVRAVTPSLAARDWLILHWRISLTHCFMAECVLDLLTHNGTKSPVLCWCAVKQLLTRPGRVS